MTEQPASLRDQIVQLIRRWHADRATVCDEGCLCGLRGDLRERLAEALTTERWGSKHQLGEHGRGHRFYAPCGICQGDVDAIVELVLPVLEFAARVREVEIDEDIITPERALHEQTIERAAEAEQQRDHALAAVDRVRRLQEITITASCRVQAIEHAKDTLHVLGLPTDLNRIVVDRADITAALIPISVYIDRTPDDDTAEHLSGVQSRLRAALEPKEIHG